MLSGTDEAQRPPVCEIFMERIQGLGLYLLRIIPVVKLTISDVNVHRVLRKLYVQGQLNFNAESVAFWFTFQSVRGATHMLCKTCTLLCA